MKSSFNLVVKHWLPIAFMTTTICALAYVAVQQSYRQSANDPQIQMAEDAAATLEGGSQIQSLSLSGTVNIADSLSPYLVFYNEAGTPTGGNGLLNGQFPALPQGVFNYVRASGEDRITWEPQAGIRDAIVVTRINGSTASASGFVMAGRSIREVEKRESNLELITDFIWILTLIGTFILEAIAFWGVKKL